MQFDSISKDFLMTAEKTDTNVFITWVAGSWKSTLIDYFTSKTSKRFVLLWTTGTAAINIWGETIHRYFWIWKNGSTRTLDRNKIEHIKSTDLFIIDEVSMMRADLFDTLDEVLRDATWVNKLFWWKQVIFVGDLLQLPPVLVRYKKIHWSNVETEEYKEFVSQYGGRFFFSAKSYNPKFFKTINLQKVYRQNNQDLINNLNLIRSWMQNNSVLSIFNSRLTSKKNLNPKAIYIGSSNWIVNEINKRKIEENKNPSQLLSASIKGEFEQEDYPVDRWINVKVDCRVMFTVNNPDQWYSNWTLWTLIKVNDHTIVVKLDNDIEVKLHRNTWLNTDWYDEMWEKIILWSFTQYPIKLAHAITIHKSQGKTFDNVIVDTWPWWCFESGMLYVALSRVTSLEWLQIIRPIKLSDVKSDEDVKNFLLSNAKK